MRKGNYFCRDYRVSCETVDRIGRGSEVTILKTHPFESLVVQDIDRAFIVYQYPVYVVIGHHGLNNKSVAMGVMDEVCITFLEGDVDVLPLALLCGPLVHVVNISEWP